MKNAGINLNIFKSHSCWSNSNSAPKNASVPIEVLKQGLKSNCRTFQKYYYRDKEDINMQYSEGDAIFNVPISNDPA